jgi:LCP family protein required for cell wall assembly
VKHRSGRSSGPRHARHLGRRKHDDDSATTTNLGKLRTLLIAERSDTERSGTDRSGTDRSGTDRSGTDRPPGALTDAETTELPAVDGQGRGRRRNTRGKGGGRARRALLGAGRGLAALTSAIVLASTGYGWASLTHLQNSLNRTDVLAELPRTQAAAADGATDILLVGSDSRTDANGNPLPLDVLKLLRTEESQGLNTDTIILVRVPNDGGRAVAVSVPRDTYVDIPGYRKDKINAAYAAAKLRAVKELKAQGVEDGGQLERESNQAGRRALVQVVQDLMGIEVDHYAEINLYGFYLLTDAIGGIEVCLKRATKDSDSGADFKAGRQTVAAGDALAFVRQRGNLPRGDLDRIVRQQVFMAAIANRVLSTGTLTDPGKLRGLTDAAQKAVVLDSGWDVLGFARQMQGIAAGSVEFVTIPVDNVDARNERGQSIVTVNQSAVHAFVSSLLTGQPPPPPTPAPTSSKPPAPPVNAKSVIVEAANGTRSPGIAGRVLDMLAKSGFRVGEPGNSPPRKTSEVHVAPGHRAVGEKIAATLGGLPVVEDPSLAADRALILLGTDYEGPGAQAFANTPLLQLDPPDQHQSADPNAPITADGIPCVN